MNREYGAEEACKFVKRLDFEPPPRRRPGVSVSAMSARA